MVQHRRFAMIAEDGDIRAVHGAAHVQAAGQGDAHVGRHAVVLEIGEHLIHDRLDRSGSVGGRGVAVDPALGVDDVGDAGAGAADGELEGAAGELAAGQVFHQGLDLGLVVHHELDVVTGGEAQMTVAVLVGDLADFADMGGGHQAGTAATDGVDFVAGFGHMHQDARLQIS